MTEQKKMEQKKLWEWVITPAVLIATFALGLSFRAGNHLVLDEQILAFFRSVESVGIIALMRMFTILGNPTTYFILAVPVVLYCLWKKEYKLLTVLVLTALGTHLVNQGMKELFERPRPEEYFRIEQGGFSFPSGHSMVSTAFYLTLAGLIKRRIHLPEPLMKASILILYILAFAPGLSRLFMGVHYPTDILLGWMNGVMLHYWYLKLYDGNLLCQIRI